MLLSFVGKNSERPIGFFLDKCLWPFMIQGYLVNWELERQIWDYCFGKDVLKVCDSSSCSQTSNDDCSMK